MPRSLWRVALGVALASFALPATAQEKLTKVEIGKRGKAATAFVDVPRGGTGTAFCVHPSGLFVTNEHVVRGAKEEVILVLNPSVEGQRVLKAKVVREDKALDLALLRVEGARDLPSLPLGSVKGVAELAEVVACGFPLGFVLAPSEKTYPAISVNAGSVTALRNKPKGGELDRIQIDVALNYGNSGGPVLDDHGKVIGVVVSSLRGGKGINLAIPVSQLEGFLEKPDVAFSPPDLKREALDKPMQFKANAVALVPNAPEPLLKLILQAGDEEPRSFPMTLKGGAWVATAPPVAKAASSRVEITARIGTATVTGTVDDVVFKAGDKPLRMSGVKRIDWKMKPVVLLADGRTTVEGDITGLGAVEIDLGGQKVKLDLSKASQLTVQPAAEELSVTATVVAVVAGREVSRTEARMLVRDPVTTSGPADPTTVKITPPALGEDKVVKRLPEVFSSVVAGGGGRYLIFHMPKLKKLAVFDVNEARITKYISLTEDDIFFAAGLDSVVVGLKKGNKLERWSLTTFEMEKSATPPFDEEIKAVLMGHGSNGPVVVNGWFLDLATFKPIPLEGGQPNRSWWGGDIRIPSGDGRVWGTTFYGPARASQSYVLEGGAVKRYDGGNLHHVIPGPDGKVAFTAKGITSQTLKYGDPEDAKYGYCVPAVRGDYFLSIAPEWDGKGGSFTVYHLGLKRSILKLDNPGHGLHTDSAGGDTYTMWRKVFFVPDAKVIVLLPTSNDRVVLYKVDPDAALEKSGQDYLLVTSSAPREVTAGATFTYPVRVKSKQGGVTFQLDSAPKGMTVDAAGVVTWAVPADATGTHDVILTVRDKSGQDVFHTFTVKLGK
ncbi:MAG TPA: trypsin-like peptidase domain-containing protein [Gemmataceae bacterium]|nr:trypsin-like peptidase domain-containing protein [Gemmataceae bacterium]